VSLGELLARAEAAPQYRGPQRRRRWSALRPVWEVLRDKGYTAAAAARWIANEQGWDAEMMQRFYEAARQWKQD